MPKDDVLYVGHMLDTARKAVARARLATRAEYDRNEDLVLALAHLVQLIGEAARRVTLATQRANPEIPWTEIIGMRHKIVHDYLSLDEDILWNVVTVDLPPLVTALERLVNRQE